MRKKTKLSLLFTKYKVNHAQLEGLTLPKEAWDIFELIGKTEISILELQKKTALSYAFVEAFINCAVSNQYLVSILQETVTNPYTTVDHKQDSEELEEESEELEEDEVVCVDFSSETTKPSKPKELKVAPEGITSDPLEIRVLEETEVSTFSFD